MPPTILGMGRKSPFSLYTVVLFFNAKQVGFRYDYSTRDPCHTFHPIEKSAKYIR